MKEAWLPPLHPLGVLLRACRRASFSPAPTPASPSRCVSSDPLARCVIFCFFPTLPPSLVLFSSPPLARQPRGASSVGLFPSPSPLLSLPFLPSLDSPLWSGWAKQRIPEGAGSRVSPRVAKAGTGWRLRGDPPPSSSCPRRLRRATGPAHKRRARSGGEVGGETPPPDLEQQHEVK